MSSPSTSPQPDAEVPARQTATQRRQADILALLREHGTLAVADLPDRYRVSAETIRRDLRHLEEVRAVTRSYGQVRVVDSGAFETDLTFRESHLVEEKLRIANAAATHLAQAETVFLDEGHLPTLLGRALPQDRALTIVTTNLRAATELSQHPPFTVITVGGRVRRSTLGVTGRWAAAMLRQLSGQTHRVITAVALHAADAVHEAASESRVRFAPLGDDDIAAYVDSGEWQGKAGAYAIQGRAAAFIAHISGSYSGIMGLPLFETVALLRSVTP